jgi:glucose/arabinose dehydrogenase
LNSGWRKFIVHYFKKYVMKWSTVKLLFPLFCLFALTLEACAGDSTGRADQSASGSVAPSADDVKLTLPAGFSSVVFATTEGSPRHLVVASNGDVYVKLRKLKGGSGILRFRDTNGDGRADDVKGFGTFAGTGIAIKNGYLYASSDEEVFRFKLDANDQVTDPSKPEKIVTGLISRGEHEPKAITLDNAGNLYVNIGAYSNACQIEDRTKGSLGRMPCPILDSAGGIWQFRADKPNQTYKDGIRYATGLRNVVGLDWNTVTNSLFVMQHGRDQLNNLYPDLYDTKQSAELPAECMYELHLGSNCGWPYIYYDQIQHKKILAPEYGGDGKKTAGDDAQDPIMAFPGHLAPNGLLFYTGTQFPEKYRNGAFVAFHGSWNRSPEPQAGFFAGGADLVASGRAKHRPCGLAQGPDGSLYVTDDTKGTIWKITYAGK